MKVEIKRKAKKFQGRWTKYFEAEIDGEIFFNQGIFRKLLGITSELDFGLFSEGYIEIQIGEKWKNFEFTGNLFELDKKNAENELQKRVDRVLSWKEGRETVSLNIEI